MNKKIINVYNDYAGRSAVPVGKGESSWIGEDLNINAPFKVIRVGFPTWGASDSSCTFSLYKWDETLENTLKNNPVFTTEITKINDCEIRSIDLGEVFPAGHYLLQCSNGKTEKDPGVWIFDSNISKGNCYINGEKIEGELQLIIELEKTPLIPFGDMDLYEEIKTSKEEKLFASRKFEDIIGNPGKFPASFDIGGVHYNGFGVDFVETGKTTTENENKKEYFDKFLHKSGIEVSVKAALHKEYASFEWTLYFENTSNKNSPEISNVKASNLSITANNPHLTGIYGDGGYDEGAYSPYDINVSGMDITINNETGRPTYGRFPYFDVKYSGGGCFFALGWPGKWSAGFKSQGNEFTVSGAQTLLKTYLKPGEKIRTPLSCFVFYKNRSDAEACNLWRRFFLDCNMRKPGGKPFPPGIAASTSWMYAEMAHATEENQIEAIKKYEENEVHLDWFWMDAGWYYKTGRESLETWLTTGTWHVDESRFPTKFRKISEYANSLGTKTLLWFEPEVVRLPLELLGETSVKKEWILPKSVTKLIDYGNREAVDYLVDRVSIILKEGKISLYRQDYGVGDPAGEYHANDEEGRSGITENHYIEGYLYFFDKLIERFPNMCIDACAAGGGRNDLETMRRAVPLHKSDGGYSEHDVKQSMNYSLFKWLPFFGTVVTGPDICGFADLYGIRSSYCSFPVFGYNLNANIDFNLVSKCAKEWREISEFFDDDFYPLTPWNKNDNDWTAWEFFDRSKGEGFIQVFRPENSDTPSITLKVLGLNNNETYVLQDNDNTFHTIATGIELISKGITLEIEKRGSRIVKVKGKK